MTQILTELRDEIKEYFENWDVKGIIDSKQTITVVSKDTKLLSKVFELTIAPIISSFAQTNNLEITPAPTQIKYPDYSLRGSALGSSRKWIALDIKSSFLKNGNSFAGFTLGSFRGSLRDPSSTRYSTYPYQDYYKHFCLCLIYTRNEEISEERHYSLRDIDHIPSIITDVEIVLQEKYKIASCNPGSGNTANIGSCRDLDAIRNGSGPFSELGEDFFEEYWRNYKRNEDLRSGEKKPYNDIDSFIKWREENVGR